jgi:peptidoglycan/LPS O-acetylase OafA/YrhL
MVVAPDTKEPPSRASLGPSVRPETRQAVILGAADGLTLVVGMLLGLKHHQNAVYSASQSAGLAELVGMTAALWLSSKRDLRHFLAAMACGVTTALACVVPAVPYLFWTGLPALLPALGILVVLGAVICWLRPEKGLEAIAETYVVLAAAGGLCYLASLR